MQCTPKIEWKIYKESKYLYFTFPEKLTHKDALTASENWKEFFLSITGKSTLIWNCLEMQGYEPMARNIWQKTIKELKGKIDRIWLISDSTIIHTGARIMSLFTSFDIKVVKTEEDIVSDN